MRHDDPATGGGVWAAAGDYDDELLVPDIQTLEFQSQDVDEDGKQVWLFRDPGAPEGPTPDEVSSLFGFHESQLYELLSIDELLSVVTELRHVILANSAANHVTEPRVGLDRGGLAERVSAFLTSPSRSLHIGIRYTDDGLFVQKADQTKELLLFMHPLREPEKNRRLGQLVRVRNLKAREDYLADKGRTRVISLVISHDQAEITDLCADVLSNVFEMRSGDELTFTLSD